MCFLTEEGFPKVVNKIEYPDKTKPYNLKNDQR